MKGDLPIANETDMLPLERNRVIPVCRMEQRPLIFIQTWDCRPPPIVQDATSVDEDIAVVADDIAASNILNFDVVATAVRVPVGANDLVLGLDIVF